MPNFFFKFFVPNFFVKIFFVISSNNILCSIKSISTEILLESSTIQKLSIMYKILWYILYSLLLITSAIFLKSSLFFFQYYKDKGNC